MAEAELVKEALAAGNARARYTERVKKGKHAPGDPVPPIPTKMQRKISAEYRKWVDELQQRTDLDWFNAIDARVKDPHCNSFVHQLIWWEYCESAALVIDTWRPRFADYSHGEALYTDWDDMGYTLHCCGLHPYTARKIATPCSDRGKWMTVMDLEFQCPVCDQVSSGYEREPHRCSLCGQRNFKLIQIA